jgi:hypothetical protein
VGKGRVGISEHTAEDGALIFRQACKLGLEGIVSKRLSAPYRSGPSRDRIKVKNPDSPAMVRARAGEWRTEEKLIAAAYAWLPIRQSATSRTGSGSTAVHTALAPDRFEDFWRD